ncbi:MAG: hypothetical protein RLZZ387_2694 [Chloroflexota bacterium]|jgi:ABC-type glycerol-3-phosphate transport system permease component
MTTSPRAAEPPHARLRPRSIASGSRIGDAGAYLFIILLVLFCLAPFVWPALSAVSTKPENVSGLYLYWPQSLTLQHFDEAINGRGGAATLLVNSLITTGGAVALAVVVCALGGYTLSRLDFPLKRPLMYAILLIQVVPSTATILPLYLIMKELHLVNTLLGVTLGMTAGQIPFILWVMKGFFDDVPRALEEAAVIDGASRMQVLARVTFPLAMPGVGAAVVLAFNSAWGTFFLPLILLSDPEKFVLPLGLFRAIIGYTNVDYGMMNAMSTIYMLPSLLFFILARRFLMRGVMAGAMAG